MALVMPVNVVDLDGGRVTADLTSLLETAQPGDSGNPTLTPTTWTSPLCRPEVASDPPGPAYI
jgi:hypothetical protein